VIGVVLVAARGGDHEPEARAGVQPRALVAGGIHHQELAGSALRDRPLAPGLPVRSGEDEVLGLEGRAFAEVQAEIEALLAASGNPAVEVTADQYGYTWLVVRTDPPDVAALVTHLVDIAQRRERYEGPSVAKPFITVHAKSAQANGLRKAIFTRRQKP
jgi:hypothetical protein